MGCFGLALASGSLKVLLNYRIYLLIFIPKSLLHLNSQFCGNLEKSHQNEHLFTNLLHISIAERMKQILLILPLLCTTFLLCLHSRCNFVFTPSISSRSITCYQNSIVIRMICGQGNSNSHDCRLWQSGPGRIGRSALFWAAEDTSASINWEIPFYSPSTSKLGVLVRNAFPSQVNMTRYFSTIFLLFGGDSFLWQLLNVQP